MHSTTCFQATGLCNFRTCGLRTQVFKTRVQNAGTCGPKELRAQDLGLRLYIVISLKRDERGDTFSITMNSPSASLPLPKTYANHTDTFILYLSKQVSMYICT